MTTPAIEIQQLHHRYGKSEALAGLSLTVEPGQCYGFFGRNGAGKTTTIKCLLNLLRPDSGSVRVFGLDPVADETAVKERIAYVPDVVAFYPWMTVREALDYLASFRPRWNRDLEASLLSRFGLDPRSPTAGLSKGERTQLALVGAIASDAELLVLDEPTAGLDPVVRREFIRTVIGAFQDSAPGRRTIFISTHLIGEFEGLIDRFCVIDRGREVLTAEADDARSRFRRIRARFAGHAPAESEFGVNGITRRDERTVELVVNGDVSPALQQIQSLGPVEISTESLSLEEIFLHSVRA